MPSPSCYDMLGFQPDREKKYTIIPIKSEQPPGDSDYAIIGFIRDVGQRFVVVENEDDQEDGGFLAVNLDHILSIEPYDEGPEGETDR